MDRLMEEALHQEAPLFMSAVNWGEVFYVAWKRHGEAKAWEARAKLREIPVVVIAAEVDRATRAAALKQKHNLGYADAFAAELAIEQRAWLVTADPDFSRLGKLLSLYTLPRHES
jgi:predicted nucleic acid-binding protein